MMTDGNAEAVFLDTNVLLRYLVVEFPEHENVRTAVDKLNQNKVTLWISRQILREFAVVLTHPNTLPIPSTSVETAKRIRAFMSTFHVADETDASTQNWLNLLETYSIGGKQIHDANIVATMQAYRIRRLFTLNVADFRRFASIITLVTLDDLLAAPADE